MGVATAAGVIHSETIAAKRGILIPVGKMQADSIVIIAFIRRNTPLYIL